MKSPELFQRLARWVLGPPEVLARDVVELRQGQSTSTARVEELRAEVQQLAARPMQLQDHSRTERLTNDLSRQGERIAGMGSELAQYDGKLDGLADELTRNRQRIDRLEKASRSIPAEHEIALLRAMVELLQPQQEEDQQ